MLQLLRLLLRLVLLRLLLLLLPLLLLLIRWIHHRHTTALHPVLLRRGERLAEGMFHNGGCPACCPYPGCWPG